MTCGDAVLVAKLRSSDRDASDGTVPELERLVQAIRTRFPNTRIVLRGDSGFAREAIMLWCETHGVYYVLGLAKNTRLNAILAPAMDRAEAERSLSKAVSEARCA